MLTADDERLDALRGIRGHAKTDPPTQRVPPERRHAQVEGIEHRHDIPDMEVQRIRRRIVWFVTRPMSTRIHEDEAVVGLQRVDIPSPMPTLEALRKPVLE